MSHVQSPQNESRVQETTPLLPRESTHPKDGKRGKSVLYRALICGFLVSLSFGVTSVPMIYVFRLMTCEAYYEKHPSNSGTLDCAKREIQASTARSISLLGATTTIFGLMNLLVTRWTINRFGVKRALLIQVFWPAARLAVQNVGVMTGSDAGILIVQASQIITVIGGPNGYILTLNAFVADIVGHEARTGALGRLQGCMMVGAATGFLIGGLIGDAFGIIAPFRVTLVLFLSCCVYVAISLPAIELYTEKDKSANHQPQGFKRFFGPLRIFAPQRWRLPDGRVITHFGALTLGIGVFLAILATGFLTTLLQLYAAERFEFSTSANGWLVSIYTSLRGLFLSILFPRIILIGRKWYQPDVAGTTPGDLGCPESEEHDPTSPNEIGPIDSMDNEIEPVNPPRSEEQQTYAFDLLYARVSILTDGILTGLATFVSEGWQLYLVAVTVPFAAGTGAASKGTILQMLPSRDRVDALSGITLVENMARLSTTAVFGSVFAALAEIGKAHLVFVCNASVAFLGFCVLLMSRFPPEGSTQVEA
ncbi:MFS general substrate transporter [Corynespora cassiicola Philippines]|uniref:MFS general substrate transporter n=1 Tax=Corynespora cassiicola Philippines TaxID=1448308 RepID=A0A2T2NAF5_CORCC|nr:MFS general substrate transporter [Corynespora cassiicola Philippines]